MQLEFSDEQIAHIAGVLAERPFREVAELMQHIQRQVMLAKGVDLAKEPPLKAVS